jgi:hypothetical protein
MNVHHRDAVNDFDASYRHAWLGYLVARLTDRPGTLRSWQEDCRQLGVTGQYDRGTEQVPVDRIVGSAQRSRDFDRHFRPLRSGAIHRWVRVARAHGEGVALPPVQLSKLGDAYYVRDGHHRVSVARVRGQTVIDAHVVEALASTSPAPSQLPHSSPAWANLLQQWSLFRSGRRHSKVRAG